MSDDEESTEGAPETEIQKNLDGANIPDGTERFDDIIRMSLLVPMEDPNDIDGIMGMPVIFWGLSGVGKSKRIDRQAKKLTLPLEIVFPSTKQPEDFSDLPVVIQNQLMTACMLTQVNALNQYEEGVLLVDEASLAVPAVQGAMLSMVLNRQVGSTRIKPGIRILLAANPPKFAAGGWGLEAPFANRMIHFYMGKPSRKSFQKYLLTMGSRQKDSIQADMATIKKNWATEFAKIRGQLAGFVDRCTEEAYNYQPDPDHVQSGYCWTSPRSWEMAIRGAATVRCLAKDPELEQLMIEAAVGAGPTLEWLEYIEKADLPDPKDVLEKGWQIDTMRLDRTMAVATSMTAFITGMTDKQEMYKYGAMGWQRLHEMMKVGLSDLVVDHAQELVNEGMGSKTKGTPDAVKAAAQPVLLELGKSQVTAHVA